jgi:putative two-component system response regulator
MKKHVMYGVAALKGELFDSKNVPSYIKTALDIVGYHHEKYDGTGYPNNLSGDNIPLPGRIMAIIDVYDALMSKRVYKKVYSFKYTVEYIRNEKGKHFDPDIVDAFLEIKDKIRRLTYEDK